MMLLQPSVGLGLDVIGVCPMPRMYVLHSVVQFGNACCTIFEASLVVTASNPNLS